MGYLVRRPRAPHPRAGEHALDVGTAIAILPLLPKVRELVETAAKAEGAPRHSATEPGEAGKKERSVGRKS